MGVLNRYFLSRASLIHYFESLFPLFGLQKEHPEKLKAVFSQSQVNRFHKENEDLSRLFGLFQIPLDSYLKTKFLLIKNLKIQPSEIEDFPYYEMDFMINEYQDWLEKENKRQEAENGKSGESLDQKTFMKNTQGEMTKGLQSMSLPKMSMPNIKF